MHVINGIDIILNHLSISNIEIIVCGDINMNYLSTVAVCDNNWIIY